MPSLFKKLQIFLPHFIPCHRQIITRSVTSFAYTRDIGYPLNTPSLAPGDPLHRVDDPLIEANSLTGCTRRVPPAPSTVTKKDCIKGYNIHMKRLDFTLLLICLLSPILNFPLNHASETLHILRTPFDTIISFQPIFILPYLSFYPLIALTLITLIKKKLYLELRTVLLAAIFTQIISYLFYLSFQTYVERPTVILGNIFGALVKWLYSIDMPYNAFPSLHASVSFLALIAWTRMKSKIRFLMIAITILIIISTLFVKQHYVIDIMGGIILAAGTYQLSVRLLPNNKR